VSERLRLHDPSVHTGRYVEKIDYVRPQAVPYLGAHLDRARRAVIRECERLGLGPEDYDLEECTGPWRLPALDSDDGDISLTRVLVRAWLRSSPRTEGEQP
jgi:hypothetical protein